jgi:hypothetical protein
MLLQLLSSLFCVGISVVIVVAVPVVTVVVVVVEVLLYTEYGFLLFCVIGEAGG